MKKKGRIVQLIVTLEQGGCEMMLLKILPLLREDFEHTIITLRQKGPVAPRFEASGIRVISLNQKNFFDFTSYRRLRKILQTLKPDLIITNLLHADIIGRFYLRNFLSCQIVSYIGTTYNSPRYWLAQLFEKCSKYFADGYIANAFSVKETYVRKFGVPEQRISVIPNGIDTNEFNEASPPEEVRTSLNISPDDFVITCVANLHVNKGHAYLLEAFEHLFTRSSLCEKKLKLLLIGDGPERKNIEKQIAVYRSKSHIHLLGRRLDISDLLKSSTVFVLPTFFEGMSNALLEAMSCSLPVITTDIPENREIITHNQTGILCPTKDIGCLARSIERLLQDNNLSQSLGTAARSHIKKHYDLLPIANRFREAFISLISKE